MPQLLFGSATDVGRVRDVNEDCVFAQPPVFLVADGMGGHAAGEVAADLATKQLATLVGRRDMHPDDVLAAIDAANRAILTRAAAHRETAGMGTTVSGMCLGSVGGSPHWYVFNVGDSRVYRLAGGLLTRLTVDHSEVQELVAAGRITASQARLHPSRNVLTRALGTDPAPVPDIWVLPCAPGETFLICSDGLTLEVSEADVAGVLITCAAPQRAADMLVRMAVQAGGRDNVSAIVVHTAGPGHARDADIATVPRSAAKGYTG